MKIDNSREAAVMRGSWSKPGAGFYNRLMKEDNYHSLINEAFLVSGDVSKDTTYASSGCKYPHHTFKDGELVVSAPGVKAAYSRAKQMGIYKGEVKAHLDKHMRELGFLNKDGVHYEDVMEENFRFIESVIDNALGTNLAMMEKEIAQLDLEVKCKEDLKHPEYGYVYDQYTLLASGTPVSEAKYLKKEKFIYDIETYPSFRRKGYAEYLVRHLVSIGARHLNVGLDNTAAITLYKKIGFHDDGYVRGDNNEKLQRMTIDDDKAKKISDKVINESTESTETTEELEAWIETVVNEGWDSVDKTDSPINDLNTPSELLSYMNQIQYGWIDKNGNRYEDADDGDFFKDYRLQSPNHLIESKLGVCWDQVELERQWFTDHKYKFRTFFIVIEDGEGKPSHTFLIYQEGNKVYWFENSWYDQRGIHEFNTLNEALKEIFDLFNKSNNNTKYPVFLYNLPKMPEGITCEDYYRHATDDENIIQKIESITESTSEDPNISKPWFIRSDDGVDNCCIKVKGYEKPMRGRSAMITLRLDDDKWEVLCKKNADDYGVPGGGWNKGETPKHAAIRELQEETLSNVKNVKRMGTLIEYSGKVKDWVKEHVPNKDDWWYGYYSAVFVGMYDGKFKGKVKAEDRESGYEWKPVDNKLMKQLPKEYQDAINDYINKGNPFKESVDVFDEKSHGELKYCYRIGYDIKTGTKIAIEFDLDPNSIDGVGDPELTKNAFKKSIGKDISDERLKDIHTTALDYIRQRIRKTGHIDFTTAALPVHSIFDESHRKYDHIEIIGLFSSAIKRVLSEYFFPKKEDGSADKDLAEKRRTEYADCISMTPAGRVLQVDKLMKRPEIRDMMLTNKIRVESYRVNETSGANKYKTTKLIWNRKQFDSLKLTPVVRGIIPDTQSIKNPTSEKNATKYISSFLNSKFHPTNESHVDSSLFMMGETHDDTYEDELIDDIANLNGWFSESAENEYCRYLTESYMSDYLRSLPYDLMLSEAKSPHEIIPTFHLVHSNLLNPLFLETLEGSTLDAAIIMGDWCAAHGIPNYIIEATIHKNDDVYTEGCVIYESDGKFVIGGRIVSNGVASRDLKTLLENVVGSFSKYFHTNLIDLNIVSSDTNSESVFTEAENDPPPLENNDQQKPTSEEEQSAEEDLSNKEGETNANVNANLADTSDTVTSTGAGSENDSGQEESQTGTEGTPGSKEDVPGEVQTTPEEVGGNGVEHPPIQPKTPISRPKQFANQEQDKNGVRRKNLYIEFIRWAKDYNNKNIFGSNFDKDIFNGSYPFVPEEMRYFYRLADPTLCILAGGLTFFPVIQLRKLNSENKHLDQYMIFAATNDDMRVFSNVDKRVYLATEQNGEIVLTKPLANTFDTYIQTMIDKGDILNGPREDTTLEYAEDLV